MGKAAGSERRAREYSVQQAVHSAALEGVPVTDRFLVDVQDYINGNIDEKGLVERTRARYGVDRS